jgi:CDGSH iron-sulfur domain-containing protein 3
MSRLVKKTDQGPQKVGDKFICMCGLSKNQPFCDGSHQQTLDEEKDKLYTYKNGKRTEAKEKNCCGGSCC